MIMPKRMQQLKMADELRAVGIDSDVVDLMSLIDSTLSYPENVKNVMGKYKRVSNKAQKSKSTRLSESSSGFDISYAAQAHQARSERSQRQDEAIRAKRTYTEKQISRKPVILEQWYKNPASMDIYGIDAFEFSKRRKQ